jgi:hypothetical protein
MHRIVHQNYRVDLDTFKVSRWEIKDLSLYIYIYIYILNDVDTQRLRNGFIYIKELLLQSHSLKTYNDHQVLINHNTNA